MALGPDFQMWVSLGVILAALVLYAWERASIEVTSLVILCALLLFFGLFPVRDVAGHNRLNAAQLLEGFGNPALITVVGLVVVGEGIVQTGLLDRTAQLVFRIGGGKPVLSLAAAMFAAMLLSSLLNNVPVVVIFVPIMQALARRLGRSPSHVMIPLGYAAVIGGKLTLIGSSNNLLVSGTLVELGLRPLGFFEFTVPGLILVTTGFLYSALVVPRILPNRAELAGAFIGTGGGKQFIAQVLVTPESKLIGRRPTAGFFTDLPDMTVRMVLRGEHVFVPPFFDDLVIEPGDLLVVAATRNVLVDAMKLAPGLLETEIEGSASGRERRGRQEGEQTLAEVMVTPGSKLTGWNLEEIGFRSQYHCIVLGIQRRSRMILARMTEIRLEAGDVLLIQGRKENVEALRAHRDVALLEWSAMRLPAVRLRWRAGLIFAAVVAAMSTDVVPTVTAALAGALAMLMARTLTLSQALRAIDSAVVMTIATALALGAALEATGGSHFVSSVLFRWVHGLSPAVTLSVFFLIVAVISNVINNKACAVIFTPIAVSLAHQLGMDPIIFAIAVVFATNSALASPIAHPATLLVMAPGHYRFRDFIVAGTPMIILNWLVFSFVVTHYYGVK